MCVLSGCTCDNTVVMSEEKRVPPYIFNSISALNHALGLPKPRQPLVDLVDYGAIQTDTSELSKALVLQFYKISFKRHLNGKVKYGQGYYEFNAGGLSFVAPNQLISAAAEEQDYSGYTLLFHPDLIKNYPLGQTIKKYGFFSYSVAEALHLSDREQATIVSVFNNMAEELAAATDRFSQDVMVSLIEVLLNYSNRFYNRQFTTRKAIHHDLLVRMEKLLDDYFEKYDTLNGGIPSVSYLTEQLQVSQRYLSDMLRQLTGQNTQQHIQARLIEKAKGILSTTDLRIAEIAYLLGFEHPQSFSKIFKRKTLLSPQDFRRSFR